MSHGIIKYEHLSHVSNIPITKNQTDKTVMTIDNDFQDQTIKDLSLSLINHPRASLCENTFMTISSSMSRAQQGETFGATFGFEF